MKMTTLPKFDDNYSVSMKEMCEVVSERTRFRRGGVSGVKLSPEEVFTLSPIGELWIVFDLFEKILMHEEALIRMSAGESLRDITEDLKNRRAAELLRNAFGFTEPEH